LPEDRQAPQLENVNLEAEPLKLGIEAINDAYALQTVKETFWGYEWYRSQNHDPRWNAHDALYTGWLPPRVWDGTTTPRSSLGMPITFGQIESAFPAIYQAIFNDDDWFQVAADPGAQAEEAKAIAAHLKYSIEHPRADYTGNSENELELAIRQGLLNGNGVVEVEYDWDAAHPRVNWVDNRDLYVDPGTPVPSIDASRSVVRRRLLSIDDIEALRSHPQMKIPAKAVLVNMARNMQYVFADKTKQVAEAFRGIQYSPSQHQWSPVPNERKIEVLIYYSRHRIIWVFNREWVAYNEQNPYGFVPFCSFPCFPIPGRYYAMSYADVIENPQRYIEALYNARLDELSLQLRPPRVRKRGSILTPAQQRWSPGAISEADDPSKDIAVLYPPGQSATAGIMGDIEYLESAVEKLTGVNAVTQSVPRPGNANRTATGMNIQAQGGASRLWPIVKHIEDYLIVPMLYKMYRMVQVHTHPGQLLPALGQGDQQIQVGAQAFKQPVRFTISASSKMLTREKLAQMVPFLAQYLLNGPFIQGLQASGQTVDMEVFAQMVQDATGTSAMYKLFRPMNQQEQQARQTPPPQVQMQAQQAQQEQQTRLQLMDKKVQGELQKTQILKQPDPGAAQQLQAKMQADQQKAQNDRQKTMMDLFAQQQKMKLEREKSQHKLMIDHLTAQQKMAHERQKSQQDMLLGAVQGKQQLQQSQEQHQNDMALQQAQGAQQLALGSAQGQQKVSQAQEAGKAKIDQSKALTSHKMKLDQQKFKLQAAAQRQQAKLKASQPAKKAA
jgi:hypothetical protein